MPVSEDEIKEYMSKYSNWNRWPERKAEFGTVNFITNETRQRAAGLISEGLPVTCSRVIDANESGSVAMHFMRRAGEDVRADGQGATIDWLGVPLHGPLTHVDAFAHQAWNGEIFGGLAASSTVTAGSGAKSGNIMPLSQGVFSRGVLLDIPRSLGLKGLEPGTPITLDQVLACEEAQHLTVESGDVLLIRTGRDQVPAGPRTGADPKAGLDPGVIPFLYERQIAVLGSDRDSDIRPHPYKSVNSPIHLVALVAMGLWLIDNAIFDDLAEACATRSRWEFAFFVAPLRIANGTGSPANPIAIF